MRALLHGGKLRRTVEHSVKTSMLEYYDVHANDYDCVYSGEFSGSELVGSDAFLRTPRRFEKSSNTGVLAACWTRLVARGFGYLRTQRAWNEPC